MTTAKFSYHSKAARLARFTASMQRGMRSVIFVFFVIAMLAGAGLWAVNTVLGSFILGLGVWLLLPLAWYRYELSHKTAAFNKGETIKYEESAAIDVVGRTRKIESPQDIWRGVRGTWQQKFFSIRFGIPNDVLDNGLSNDSGVGKKVIRDAIDIAHAHKQNYLSSSVLMVALIKSLQNYESLLAQAHLDIKELEKAIGWVDHTEHVIKRLGEKSHFGGIARDWTAGYTPTLNRLAHNMSEDVQHGGFMHRDLEIHSKTVDDMTNLMGTSARKNVALIGDTGVGKTTTVYAFAQKLLTDKKLPESLRYYQVYSLDASNLISQTDSGASLENVVINVLNEAYKAKNIILFFDEAQLFFKQGTGSVNLTNVLKPALEGGGVPVIMALSPEAWQNISEKNKAINAATNIITINEPSEEDSLRVMEDQSLLIEARHKVTFMYQALKEAYRLAERYDHEIAFPGKAIKLMEASVNHAENYLVTEHSVQAAIETTTGVKVQKAGDEEKKELLNLEQIIHKRMINQSRAVKVVSDALRRARSGVGNPDKPIGTFLFLGPTGVGKTELAKSVAAAYFSGEENIIRVDMNEYTQSSDVKRLLDPSESSSIIAGIRRQPFSVVLFDEIEKAHPDVVNVFLQLLDEGVLRDSKNKQASFKDAIVVATSNAGADQIRKYIEAGKEVSQFEEKFVNDLIDNGQFKSEFLNRFDETVVFRPLLQEELLEVVDLLINEVNTNLKRQKVSVTLSSEAKVWLVKEGYDARLGARPLRRTVQRTVENIVAKKLLEDTFKPGSTLNLGVEDLESEK